MVDKCRKCGEPTAKFPLLGQPGKTFGENYKEGTINWINLFKMDWYSIMLIISIVFIIWSVNEDMTNYKEIIENQCDYCENVKCSDFWITPEGELGIPFKINLSKGMLENEP